MLHSYLDALSHQDRGLAPFARNARYTENNVEMPLGEGLWGSVGGLSATGLEVADPVTAMRPGSARCRSMGRVRFSPYG